MERPEKNDDPPLDSALTPTEQAIEDGSTASLLAQHMNQGLQCYQQRELDSAMHEFEAALALVPDDGGARLMRGIVLRELGQHDEAEKVLGGLVDRTDVAAQALTNLSVLARIRGDSQRAEEYLRSAIAKNFQFAPAHYNLAIALLEKGDLREGFREYEWRWHTRQFARFPSAHPRWDGKPLDGTLLVHTEQGTEDTIHFCRYLPRIRQLCRGLTLVCAERMASIFSVPEWADAICFPGEIAADSFHAYLPLLSAPHIFQTDLDTIPADIPYLHPRPIDVPLGPPPISDPKLRVAIAWGSGPADVADPHRYCALADFAPLFQIPKVAYYMVQQESARDDSGQLSQWSANVRNVADRASTLGEMASLLKQFDLLISTDTTLVHLAGAMGMPSWTLLSPRCHWRWMRERDDSPWYPTMRLFRQSDKNGWYELMQRVARELAAVTDSQGLLPSSRRPGK